MNQILIRVWNWLVTSSEDPSKFSARFYGIMVYLSGFIAQTLTKFGWVTSNVDVINWAADITQAGGIIFLLFGVIRLVSNYIDNRVPVTPA